jgi:hypothetical protein
MIIVTDDQIINVDIDVIQASGDVVQKALEGRRTVFKALS